MNTANPLSECLKLIAEIKQADLNQPTEEDQALLKLKELSIIFINLNASERHQVLGDLPDNRCWLLLDLSCGAAEMAINTNDTSWIRVGILAHIIEDFRIDYRENTRRLVLIDYACRVMNIKLKEVVDAVNDAASERAGKGLSDFCSRPPAINDPALFGIKVENRDGKIKFMPL
ncbi:hypothetical protein [Chitinophaga sp. YIM B06452]|uniref:hypothetical protein n=1 Tax=Chitinophaga sp. YIM B06452 TaxID=3082158 RepID=UPI0031FE7D7A